MKQAAFTFLILLMGLTFQLSAQTDSSSTTAKKYTLRDSTYAAKINYAGNLMIGSGVGLTGVGTFLVYEGAKIYQTPAAPASTDPAGDVQRNHNQGTAYIAGGTSAYVGAAVLIGLGVRNKLDFKRRKKMMSLEGGLLQDGNLGAMLNF